MKVLIIAATILLNVAGCSKTDDAPNNVVNVTATVGNETDNSTGFPVNFWNSTAQLSRSVTDSAFVVVQWDAHNGTGAYQATYKDTVKLAQGIVTMTHRSRIQYASPWTAKNVKILNTWAKSGNWVFQY